MLCPNMQSDYDLGEKERRRQKLLQLTGSMSLPQGASEDTRLLSFAFEVTQSLLVQLM